MQTRMGMARNARIIAASPSLAHLPKAWGAVAKFAVTNAPAGLDPSLEGRAEFGTPPELGELGG